MSYCDNCGDKFENNNLIPVRKLRFNVSSANKGESALLCVMCNYKKNRRIQSPATKIS